MFQLSFCWAGLINATSNYSSYICWYLSQHIIVFFDEHWLLNVLPWHFLVIFLPKGLSNMLWFYTHKMTHAKDPDTVCCQLDFHRRATHPERTGTVKNLVFYKKCVTGALSSVQPARPKVDTYIHINTPVFQHQKHLWVTLLLLFLSITLTQIQ